MQSIPRTLAKAALILLPLTTAPSCSTDAGYLDRDYLSTPPPSILEPDSDPISESLLLPSLYFEFRAMMTAEKLRAQDQTCDPEIIAGRPTLKSIVAASPKPKTLCQSDFARFFRRKRTEELARSAACDPGILASVLRSRIDIPCDGESCGHLHLQDTQWEILYETYQQEQKQRTGDPGILARPHKKL